MVCHVMVQLRSCGSPRRLAKRVVRLEVRAEEAQVGEGRGVVVADPASGQSCVFLHGHGCSVRQSWRASDAVCPWSQCRWQLGEQIETLRARQGR